MHNIEFSAKLMNFSQQIQGALTAILWLLLIYGFDEPYVAGLTIAAALIHECGHILCLWFIGGRGFRAIGRLNGPRLGGIGLLSYEKDLLLCASGPGANLCAALLALPFLAKSGYATAFITLNLLTALSNLLPIAGHDGYGIALALFGMLGGCERGAVILRGISTAMGALGCVFSLYMMEKLGESYWLFAVFYFSMLGELGERLKSHF